MAPPSTQSLFPWTSSPLVISAPMGGFAGGQLASAVSLSRGLGQIGAVNSSSSLDRELEIARDQLSAAGAWKQGEELPIGVGLLPFIIDLEAFIPVLVKYRPAVVWLFAAKTVSGYASLARSLREHLPSVRIIVQTCSVTAALEIAKSEQPNALVLQGSDAGGHGYERGCGIVSLIPETLDALEQAGLGDIPIFAAGGIADARGAAAAFALGASGVVVGTRFLAARETTVPAGYRDRLLKAKDGGQSTVRSKMFDEVQAPNIWPDEYDGRSLVTESFRDWRGGIDIKDIRERHNRSVGEGKGYDEDRANIWAGSAVGLVNNVQGAEEIVREVRDGVKSILEKTIVRCS